MVWSQLGDAPLDLAYHSLFAHTDHVYSYGGHDGKGGWRHEHLGHKSPPHGKRKMQA